MIATVEQQAYRPTENMADKVRCRREYVTGNGGLEVICFKLAISYNTARRWFADEDWPALKHKYDDQQKAKLFAPEPRQTEQQQTSNTTTTQDQLELVNKALLACVKPMDIAKLVRAKLELTEALHIEKHGAKLGTMAQQRQNRTRRQSYTQPDPTPVEPEKITPEKAGNGYWNDY